jgi:hypothetical protein
MDTSIGGPKFYKCRPQDLDPIIGDPKFYIWRPQDLDPIIGDPKFYIWSRIESPFYKYNSCPIYFHFHFRFLRILFVCFCFFYSILSKILDLQWLDPDLGVFICKILDLQWLDPDLGVFICKILDLQWLDPDLGVFIWTKDWIEKTKTNKQYSQEPEMKMKIYWATVIFVKWGFNPIQMKIPDSMGSKPLTSKNLT